ncbi:MAG: hypothetical protein WD894_22420 [Pirellulales bacterium]
MRRNLVLWLGTAMSVAAFTGCRGLTPPNIFHPGPADYQRNQAKRFDPYPESDIGPSMDEARPPDFQQAMPVTTRSRWTLGS